MELYLLASLSSEGYLYLVTGKRVDFTAILHNITGLVMLSSASRFHKAISGS